MRWMALGALLVTSTMARSKSSRVSGAGQRDCRAACRGLLKAGQTLQGALVLAESQQRNGRSQAMTLPGGESPMRGGREKRCECVRKRGAWIVGGRRHIHSPPQYSNINRLGINAVTSLRLQGPFSTHCRSYPEVRMLTYGKCIPQDMVDRDESSHQPTSPLIGGMVPTKGPKGPTPEARWRPNRPPFSLDAFATSCRRFQGRGKIATR